MSSIDQIAQSILLSAQAINALSQQIASGGFFTYTSASVLSPIILASGTPANVNSLQLSAGNWDLDASIGFQGDGNTTFTVLIGSISKTSATLDQSTPNAYNSFVGQSQTLFVNGDTLVQAIAGVRASLSTAATVYLVAQAGFAVGACEAFGTLTARKA